MADRRNSDGVTVGKIAAPEIVKKMVETSEADKVDSKYKGVHTRYDGVNEALRQLGYDAIASTQAAEAAGVVFGHGARGGYILSTTPVAASSSSKAQRLVDAVSDETNLGGKNGKARVVQGKS